MRIVLLGPPGAGKGSLAQLMHDRFRMLHLASGDLLREAVRDGTELGRKAQAYMSLGQLVPDQLVTAMILERLPSSRSRGVALDGFPRTQAQAVELDAALAKRGLAIDRALYFETSPEMVLFRLAGRRVCRSCGTIYHMTNHPPVHEGRCDRCSAPLEQRQDDRPETIAKRMAVDVQQTAPLLEYYRSRSLLRVLDGNQSVEGLYQAVTSLLRQEQLLPPEAS